MVLVVLLVLVGLVVHQLLVVLIDLGDLCLLEVLVVQLVLVVHLDMVCMVVE